MKPENYKLLFIWDRVGDYHRARLDACKNLFGNNNVFSCDLGAKDNLYLWDNSVDDKHFVLSDKKVEQTDIFNRVKNYLKIINKNKIDVCCIAGYGRIEYLLFIFFAFVKRKKIVVFAESWYKSGSIIDFLKSIFLRMFVKRFFVSGKRAFLHFSKVFKIKEKHIKLKYSVIDNEHFKNSKQNLSDKNVILAIARFSKEKNLDVLIKAFLISKISKNFQLMIIGATNESKIDEYKNYQNIVLKKWVSYNELPDYYHNAKLFVLPSIFEPWGLVVNEAMAAGLPIIASKQCGCVPELVKEENGFVFDAENKNELIEIFNKIIDFDDQKFRQMGKSSLKIINEFTPQIWAETIHTFVNK